MFTFTREVMRAGGVAQVAKHLPSKYEALSSDRKTTQKKKKNELWEPMI
jgi:dihydroxyacid dehydratase/phosphogluconate dehydratase